MIAGLAMSGQFERARVPKSASAFRTISEVADELDVPQHVLRFWETRFTQIRPLKRAGGRRYYRPEDVDLLRRIRGLLYQQGYTIKGVQKLLRDSPRERAEKQAATAVEADPAIIADEPAIESVSAIETSAAAPSPVAVDAPGATNGSDAGRLSARAAIDELIVELETVRAELDRLRRAVR